MVGSGEDAVGEDKIKNSPHRFPLFCFSGPHPTPVTYIFRYVSHEDVDNGAIGLSKRQRRICEVSKKAGLFVFFFFFFFFFPFGGTCNLAFLVVRPRSLGPAGCGRDDEGCAVQGL